MIASTLNGSKSIPVHLSQMTFLEQKKEEKIASLILPRRRQNRITAVMFDISSSPLV